MTINTFSLAKKNNSIAILRFTNNFFLNNIVHTIYISVMINMYNVVILGYFIIH